MSVTKASERDRRYLLGEGSEDECAVIEQEYLEDEGALDRIAAVEEALIEDYLAGDLAPLERDRFERKYLSTPNHRVRVETIRRLRARASAAGAVGPPARLLSAWTRVRYHGPWLALAASVLLVASLAFWRFATVSPPADVAQTMVPTPAAPPRETPLPPAVNVFALTLSSAGVRGGSESAPVVVPAGTDVLVVRFEADGDGPMLTASRAAIQVVGGGEVWQGPVTHEDERPPATVARVDVPVAAVPADDYLVTLFGRDRSNVEREWARYFLSLRTR